MGEAEAPVLAAYDQEAWAREQNYEGDDLNAALAAYRRLHVEHIAELEVLPSVWWERTGRHEEQGRITIGGQALHMVAPDLIHAARNGRQLGRAGNGAMTRPD